MNDEAQEIKTPSLWSRRRGAFILAMLPFVFGWLPVALSTKDGGPHYFSMKDVVTSFSIIPSMPVILIWVSRVEQGAKIGDSGVWYGVAAIGAAFWGLQIFAIVTGKKKVSFVLLCYFLTVLLGGSVWLILFLRGVNLDL